MGLFDNANKVMIGNKEVQSIKIGNNVIYEKQSSNTLFFDACDNASGLTNYSSPVNLYNSSINGSPSLSYNSTENAYEFSNNSSNDWLVYPIDVLDGESNFTFSCELKLNNSSSVPYIGLGVIPNTSQLSSTYGEIFYAYRYSSSKVYCYAQRRRRTNKSSNLSTGNYNHSPTNWLRIKAVFNSTNGFTITWEEVSNGNVIKTYTGTTTSSGNNRHFGIFMRSNSNSYKGWIRNVKAERNEVN